MVASTRQNPQTTPASSAISPSPDPASTDPDPNPSSSHPSLPSLTLWSPIPTSLSVFNNRNTASILYIPNNIRIFVSTRIKPWRPCSTKSPPSPVHWCSRSSILPTMVASTRQNPQTTPATSAISPSPDPASTDPDPNPSSSHPSLPSPDALVTHSDLALCFQQQEHRLHSFYSQQHQDFRFHQDQAMAALFDQIRQLHMHLPSPSQPPPLPRYHSNPFPPSAVFPSVSTSIPSPTLPHTCFPLSTTTDIPSHPSSYSLGPSSYSLPPSSQLPPHPTQFHSAPLFKPNRHSTKVDFSKFDNGDPTD